MATPLAPYWIRAPFVRLLPPLIAGILWQQYLPFCLTTGLVILCLALIFLFLLSTPHLTLRFRYQRLYSLPVHLAIFAVGGLAADTHDRSEEVALITQCYSATGASTLITLREPPAERPKTFKSQARISEVVKGEIRLRPAVDMLVYFRKDSLHPVPEYGDRIVFWKTPERIQNREIFGTFDYQRYCARRDIYFQVFLRPGDYRVLAEKGGNRFDRWLNNLRDWVLSTLQQYIPGDKACGLAEALLIGYKDHLDRTLMQAYSNTGVIHVVAISGLHLGLIYALLRYCCLPLGRRAPARWLSPLVIITGLWVFSLLTGGSPSVVRSAVMFTAIVLGESFSRRTPILNNLAASAFFLLCYNPKWLGDIGFQLSYTALLGIVLFMQPIYQLFTPKQALLRSVWKLNAITLAAQVLTAPLCIFYFQQFPVLFLITNFIAVPLSSAVLIGEIGLCAAAAVPALAKPLGALLAISIRFMNHSIEWIDSLTFSSWTNLQINVLQTMLLYLFIGCMAGWLVLRQKRWVYPALVCTILFFVTGYPG